MSSLNAIGVSVLEKLSLETDEIEVFLLSDNRLIIYCIVYGQGFEKLDPSSIKYYVPNKERIESWKKANYEFSKRTQTNQKNKI
ncbi:hypothetical protein GCM10009120_04540 [Sphingobacterium siyangense subsp. cladoniae]